MLIGFFSLCGGNGANRLDGVSLKVEELELSKAKATDLLKAHDGDAVQAMRAFVTASG